MLSVLALLSVACGSEWAAPSPTPSNTPIATSDTAIVTLRPILASTDLAVGRNRLVFALLNSASAPVQATVATVVLAHASAGDIAPGDAVPAVFRVWPTGPGGVFTANVTFDRSGDWLAEFSPGDGEAAGETGRAILSVAEESVTPALDSPAPVSRNRTAADVSSLSQLTSDTHPDPDLYAVSIAESVETGKPLVVTFATPAFCSSATCGPQVDVIKTLKDAHNGDANFIHVEIYSNPDEMHGDPTKGLVAQAVTEWALPSEPWTFLVDGDGKVAAKFEAFTSLEELEDALLEVLP